MSRNRLQFIVKVLPMNNQANFNRDILVAAPSFVAVIHYKRESKDLFLVLRKNGWRYRYSNVPVHVFNELMNATNKGSFISLNIVSGNKYPCTKLDPMPMATLEQLIKPASFRNWLAR